MTRVLLIEDQPTVRKAVRRLLEMLPHLEVVGEAGDGASGMRLTVELLPDLVIVDCGLPDVHGIAVTRHITSQPKRPKVIGFSASEGVGQSMLEAGADAFVPKSSPDRLIHEIKKLRATG